MRNVLTVLFSMRGKPSDCNEPDDYYETWEDFSLDGKPCFNDVCNFACNEFGQPLIKKPTIYVWKVSTTIAIAIMPVVNASPRVVCFLRQNMGVQRMDFKDDENKCRRLMTRFTMMLGVCCTLKYYA